MKLSSLLLLTKNQIEPEAWAGRARLLSTNNYSAILRGLGLRLNGLILACVFLLLLTLVLGGCGKDKLPIVIKPIPGPRADVVTPKRLQWSDSRISTNFVLQPSMSYCLGQSVDWKQGYSIAVMYRPINDSCDWNELSWWEPVDIIRIDQDPRRVRIGNSQIGTSHVPGTFTAIEVTTQ